MSIAARREGSSSPRGHRLGLGVEWVDRELDDAATAGIDFEPGPRQRKVEQSAGRDAAYAAFRRLVVDQVVDTEAVCFE